MQPFTRFTARSRDRGEQQKKKYVKMSTEAQCVNLPHENKFKSICVSASLHEPGHLHLLHAFQSSSWWRVSSRAHFAVTLPFTISTAPF